MKKCFEVKMLVETEVENAEKELFASSLEKRIRELVKFCGGYKTGLTVLDSSIRTVEGKELRTWMYLLKS